MNKINKINNEIPVPYKATARAIPDLNATLAKALQAILTALKSNNLYPAIEAFTAPDLVKNYRVISLALEEREHFHVVFLDNQHKLLLETMSSLALWKPTASLNRGKSND